jgi:hypothetical protein
MRVVSTTSRATERTAKTATNTAKQRPERTAGKLVELLAASLVRTVNAERSVILGVNSDVHNSDVHNIETRLLECQHGRLVERCLGGERRPEGEYATDKQAQNSDQWSHQQILSKEWD